MRSGLTVFYTAILTLMIVPPAFLSCTSAAGADEGQSNLQTDKLVAWCIVPFDAKQRGPEARAQMLDDLGLTRLAYDWREEHVPSWDQELDALKAHDIELFAFWCSSSLKPLEDPGVQRIVDFLKRRQVSTQLWIMLSDHQLAQIEEEGERVAAAAQPIRELAEHVAPLGCQVGLYNHGGWIGRPETLVRIMQAVDDLNNVGIVYNFHHAHEDLAAFPQAMKDMLPYLLCLNLNGTTPDGPKILPIGQGKLDRQILRWIEQSGYAGPIGILDHRNELDARESLTLNIQGLRSLTPELN